jgi:hypothetical protein
VPLLPGAGAKHADAVPATALVATVGAAEVVPAAQLQPVPSTAARP